MAAKIRLTRVGAKKQPSYRVVVQEERSKRDGQYIDNLGYYNPRTDPPTVVIDAERVKYWLGVGAQPSDSVGRLLRMAGITDKYYRQKGANKQPAAPPAASVAPAAEPPAA